MKKLLATCLIFVGLLFLFTPETNAENHEGNYTCKWTTVIQGGRSATQISFCDERQIVDNCTKPDFLPPTDPCNFSDKASCEAKHPCRPSPLLEKCEPKATPGDVPCRTTNPQRPALCYRGQFDAYCCTTATACKSATKPKECPTSHPVPIGNQCCGWADIQDGVCDNPVERGKKYCEPLVYDPETDSCIGQAELPSKASEPIFCNNETGIETAIGCIPIRDTTAFVAFLLRWSIGIAGGIAFLLMLFAAFQIMTSAGNPERLQGGRELLTAAISGLILIIFSVFLLRLIGVEILQLPGLGQ